MRKFFALLGLALGLSAFNAQAADTSATLGHVGNWTVKADTDGCFTLGDWIDGTEVMFGFYHSTPVVAVGNHQWTWVRGKQSYAAVVVFDGYDRYTGTVTGGYSDYGVPMLTLDNSPTLNFAKAMMNHNSMAVYINGQLVANLSLANSFRALQATAQCALGQRNGAQPQQTEAPHYQQM